MLCGARRLYLRAPTLLMRDYPYPAYDGVRSIVLGIVISILTCGIYYFYPFAFFLVPLALGLACSPSRLGRTWLALPLARRKSLAGGVLALALMLWLYRLMGSGGC